ncbi:MAG: PA2779 family protein [Gammaproteobacteria bacterium]|nr:PA2779 family protein [Gammaproteobacteria bacterium]
MSTLQRSLAWLLSLLLTLTPVMTVQAAMIGTDTLLESAQTHNSLQQILGREVAQQQLLALGVDPEWVAKRTENLSESELARINQGIEQLNAGGDVLGVLLVVLIVFVITDVIGATDIFPFIHPIN